MANFRRRGESQVSEANRITDFRECMIDGRYGRLFFRDYEAYVRKQVWRVRRYYKGGRILSVGCGPGDIEAALPYSVVCYDIHDAALVNHPELDFRYSWPNDQYELILCLGTVLPYVPTDQQNAFIERLLSTVTDDGQILIHGINYCPLPQWEIEDIYYRCEYPSHPQIKVIRE